MIFGDSMGTAGRSIISSTDYHRLLAEQMRHGLQNASSQQMHCDVLSSRAVTPEEWQASRYDNNKKEQMNEKLLLLIEE